MRLTADLALGDVCGVAVLIILRPLNDTPTVKIVDYIVILIIFTVEIGLAENIGERNGKYFFDLAVRGEKICLCMKKSQNVKQKSL